MTTTLRSDIRTRVRDYLYEATADWISDAQLNRLITEEVNSLPSKEIYREDIWEFTSAVDDQDYAFESYLEKIEKVEKNQGTASRPDWVEVGGWDTHNDILYLPYLPSAADPYRAFGKYAFTPPTGDVVALDVPDEKIEVVVWGVVVRCYRLMIGYFRDVRNWDSISKPDGVSIASIQNWLRDAERHYMELIKGYATSPRPREIDLVS